MPWWGWFLCGMAAWFLLTLPLAILVGKWIAGIAESFGQR